MNRKNVPFTEVSYMNYTQAKTHELKTASQGGFYFA